VCRDLRYFVPNPSFKGKGKNTKRAPAAETLPVTQQQPDAAVTLGSSNSSTQADSAHTDGSVVVVEVQAGTAAVDAASSAAEVPEELELLKGINAFAEPGSLLALMGGSGAGKTTLMDVIAGRKTVGRITGDILVNGRPKQQSSWARRVGGDLQLVMTAYCAAAAPVCSAVTILCGSLLS
jgi:ABC-type glutathione transport system ATPase component